MIVGLGTDLVEVARVRAAVDRFGDRFLSRIFTAEETRYCALRRDPAESLAARFAAKEAASKALGTGFSGVFGWRDIEVARVPGERPRMTFHGEARVLAEGLQVARILLSLSHTATLAIATVVLERN